jgi:hypothetical protein
MFGERVIFVRKFSEEAVNFVPDEIDFLYIDGNHRYKYVSKELELYYPKVKKGGVIIGDDAYDVDDTNRTAEGDVILNWYPGFAFYGVVKAFRDFCSKMNIEGRLIVNQYMIQK